jgi:hypothetical protein
MKLGRVCQAGQRPDDVRPLCGVGVPRLDALRASCNDVTSDWLEIQSE